MSEGWKRGSRPTTLTWDRETLPSRFYRDCWRGIHREYPGRFFTRDGQVVERQGMHLAPASTKTILAALDHAVRVSSMGTRHHRKLPPLRRIASDMVENPVHCDQAIRQITCLPFLTPVGLHTEAGLESETQWFLESSGPAPRPDVTSCEALEVLTPLEVFKEQGSLEGGLSLLLTLIARPLIDGPCPLFLLDAPQGSLAPIGFMQALGELQLCGEIGALPLTTFPDEADRLLSEWLLEAPTLVLLPNIPERVLRQATILPEVVRARGEVGLRRVKERTRKIRLMSIFVASASDPEFSDQLAPCCVRLKMSDDPDLGPQWLKSENRRAVVEQLLGIGESWNQAGRPMAAPEDLVPGFEQWSSVVGGLLQVLGGDPAVLRRLWRPQRPFHRGLKQLFDGWCRGPDGRSMPESVGTILGHARALSIEGVLRAVHHAKGPRGSETILGLALQELVRTRRPISGWTLRSTIRNKRHLYWPEQS